MPQLILAPVASAQHFSTLQQVFAPAASRWSALAASVQLLLEALQVPVPLVLAQHLSKA
jgi:hypothetical protein